MFVFAVFFNFFLMGVFGLNFTERLFPAAIFCIAYGIIIDKICDTK
jgi:hypothetical protein